ncbi:MAG: plastocyanin/azurin family copper-binding protein [Actinomycetota bacterium]|nr:plastocyanin/azurin family copper-binding protein [Actinomycetota bacterium]
MNPRMLVIGLGCALSLIAGACGGDAPRGHNGHDASGDPSTETGFTFGEPADVADADRTIEVRGTDQLRFEPHEIEVEAGETVAFEFVNEAKVPHELVLGDAAAMEAHQQGHEHGAVAENATGEVAPGETKTIAWTFSSAGEFVYECHIAEHDEAGMRGTISVSER